MTSPDSLETRWIDTSQSPADEGAQSGQSSSKAQRQEVDETPVRSPNQAEGRLPEGHLLQDRYRILGVLAVGGMSSVYKAQDLRFSKVTRVCAIKEMVNTASDEEVRDLILRNFERETNILAALNHPGIVQVYDCFTEGERSYLVRQAKLGAS